ncbi:hypothetical protein CDAR_264131, partial [Caerostris darwini]
LSTASSGDKQREPRTKTAHSATLCRTSQCSGPTQLVRRRRSNWWLLWNLYEFRNNELRNESGESGYDVISRHTPIHREKNINVIFGSH